MEVPFSEIVISRHSQEIPKYYFVRETQSIQAGANIGFFIISMNYGGNDHDFPEITRV